MGDEDGLRRFYEVYSVDEALGKPSVIWKRQVNIHLKYS